MDEISAILIKGFEFELVRECFPLEDLRWRKCALVGSINFEYIKSKKVKLGTKRLICKLPIRLKLSSVIAASAQPPIIGKSER